MYKKIAILFIALLLALTACSNGSSNDDLIREIELLKSENESLKEENGKLNEENQKTKESNSTLRYELNRLKSQLEHNSKENEGTKSSNLDLEIAIEEHLLDGEVSFSIETNLPNNTEAIVTLENDKDYIAQDKIAIYGGRAKTAYFSDGDSPIPYGDYTVEFLLPYSQSQPEDVQKILGDDYKNLISDKKEKDEYGVSISVTKKISIKKTTDN